MASARRRTSQRAAALAMLGAGLAACSLLTGLDDDYALQSGSGGGNEDGAKADAFIDNDRRDGQNTTDGATEQSPPTDAGARFCETVDAGGADAANFFCEDFEDGDLNVDAGIRTGWAGINNIVDKGSGTMTLVNGVGVGGSRALDIVSTIAEDAGSSGRRQRLFTELTVEPSDLVYELEFDFRVLSTNVSYQEYGVVAFGSYGTSEKHGVAGYGFKDRPAWVARQAIPPSYPSPTQYLLNDVPLRWHHAAIRLKYAMAGATFTRTITIDNEPVDDDPNPNHRADAGNVREIWVGIFNSTDPGTSHAQFDNIVFRGRRGT